MYPIPLKAYNRGMPENTIDAIKVWELSGERGAFELKLPELSSLDAVTRQLPQGLYTTFRTYAGGKRVLGLRAHLQRLYQPAVTQQSKHSVPSVPVEKLRYDLAEILQAYPDEARVRLMMAADGQVYIAVEPLKTLPPEIYVQGVKVVTTGVERQNPRLKSTSFITASESTRTSIARSKIFEALLVRNSLILEGMTSNFFYVREGKLGTARKDILLGVTRQTVLRVARGSGLEIVYKPLKREHVPALNEAFLTSSSRGIVPIVRIDAMTVGEGGPGSITQRIMKAYDEYIVHAAEQI
jgi:branched-chain amino acid aminotransferase